MRQQSRSITILHHQLTTTLEETSITSNRRHFVNRHHVKERGRIIPEAFKTRVQRRHVQVRPQKLKKPILQSQLIKFTKFKFPLIYFLRTPHPHHSKIILYAHSSTLRASRAACAVSRICARPRTIPKNSY